MNLVNELQVSAENDDVLTVLRKAKRLASKLERPDISAWLDAEQGGYASSQGIPDYRHISISFAYNTNGYIPAGYGMLMKGVQDLPKCGLEQRIPIMDSISTVMTWIEKDAGQIYRPIETTNSLSRAILGMYNFDLEYAQQITFLIHFNGSQIKAMPEHIKDKVMDWALRLERAGITGEGLTFSVQEKQKAHAVTFNLNACNIDQLNNSGNNVRIDT